MNTLKRLLSPIKKMSWRYFLFILTSAWFGIMWPINARLISRSIKWMEMKDFDYFKTYILIFMCFLVVMYLTHYAIRTFRKITVRKFAKSLWDYYLKKYIKSDNNKIEWLWTWQSNTILQKWIESWRASFDHYWNPFCDWILCKEGIII